MSSATAYSFDRQRIVVADEDSATSTLIISTLRCDGHCAALDPAAFETGDFFSLTRCHLLISSLRVQGVLRPDLLQELQQRLPALPILYLATASLSSADLAVHLPFDLPILGNPFTTRELRAAVRPLLPGLRIGTVIARPAESGGLAGGATTTLDGTLPNGADSLRI